PLEASGVARIDDDLEREAPNPRRIVLWSGTVLLLALLLTGLYEFRHERQVARVLDVLGISNGMDAGDQAGVYASAVGPTDQVTPGIAANTEAATPMPPDPTAADSPMNATAPDSPASTPFAANAGAAATAAPAAAAHRPAPAPPPPPAAQQHAPPALANPREACGARTQFSLYRCMQTQCSQR